MTELTLEQKRAIAIAEARMRAAQAQAGQPQPAAPANSFTEAPPPEEPTLAKQAAGEIGYQIGGAADVMATLASSGIAEPIAGLAGLATGIWTGDWDKAADVVNGARTLMTWSPKTEAGQRIFGTVGAALDQGMTAGRDVLVEGLGASPGVATAVETAVIGGPALLGLTKGGANFLADRKMAQKAAVKGSALERKAASLGVDFSNTKIRETTVNAAEKMLGGQTAKGDELADLAMAVRKQADAEKKLVDAKWNDARQHVAAIKYPPIKAMVASAYDDLIKRGFDVARNTRLGKRIAELEAIDKKIPGRIGKSANRKGVAPETSTILGPDGKPMVVEGGLAPENIDIPLSDFHVVLQRINNDIRTVGAKTPEGVGLIKFKKQIEKHLDAEFDRAAITGDKAAITAWKEAKEASTAWSNRFMSDKVIRNMVQNQATPERISQWILGAQGMSKKREAGMVVNRLKQILGADSAEVDAIRTHVMIDALDPILRSVEPGASDFRAVDRNLHKLWTQNRSLMRALKVDASDIDLLRRASRTAASAVQPKDVVNRGLIAQMAARFSAGHEIAKAGATVKLVNMVFDKTLGVGQKTHKQLIREFTGRDPDEPLIGPRHARYRDLMAYSALVAELEQADVPPEER